MSIEIEAKEFSWATEFDMPLGVMRLWKVYYKEEEQISTVTEAIDFGRTTSNTGSPLSHYTNLHVPRRVESNRSQLAAAVPTPSVREVERKSWKRLVLQTRSTN